MGRRKRGARRFVGRGRRGRGGAEMVSERRVEDTVDAGVVLEVAYPIQLPDGQKFPGVRGDVASGGRGSVVAEAALLVTWRPYVLMSSPAKATSAPSNGPVAENVAALEEDVASGGRAAGALGKLESDGKSSDVGTTSPDVMAPMQDPEYPPASRKASLSPLIPV